MASKITKRETAKLLRAAANDLINFGWVRHTAGNETKGFCAVGAISHARAKLGWVHDDLRYRRAVQATQAYLASIDVTKSVIGYNDSVAKNRDDVVGLFRATARALEHGLRVSV